MSIRNLDSVIFNHGRLLICPHSLLPELAHQSRPTETWRQVTFDSPIPGWDVSASCREGEPWWILPSVLVRASRSLLALFSGKQAPSQTTRRARLVATGGGEQGNHSPARSNQSELWRIQRFS